VVLGPVPESGFEGQILQRVEWEVPGRNGYASYEVSTLTGAEVDEDALIVEAVEDSQAPVQLERRAEYYFGPTGVQWCPIGIVNLLIMVVVIAGPQPRLATKWAWFWLGFLPLGCAAFLVLEPVPLWQRQPALARQGRLTGGWAWLAAVLTQPIAARLIDGWYQTVPW